MGLPVVVQAPNTVVVSGLTSGTVTFASPVTAGNSIITGVVIGGSATHSWTVTDNINAGSYTSDVLFQPAQSMQIHHKHNSVGGTPTVTWTVDAGTFSGFIFAIEVSGLDAAGTSTTGTLNESPATSNSHNCNGSAITGSNVFALCVGCLNAAASTIAAGTNYTIAPNATDTNRMIQYAAQASMNDSGPWSSTGTARTGMGAMAVFPSPAGGGGASTTDAKILITQA